MILHIIPDEKFTLDFIRRTESLFDISEHYFWIYGCQSYRDNWEEYYFDYINKTNFIFSDYNRDTAKIFEEKLEEAKIVVLHSLFNSSMLFSINKYITRKDKTFVWIIWGADFYNAYDIYHNWRILLLHPRTAMSVEWPRMKFIKNVQYVSAFSSEYELLKERYKTQAKNLPDIFYSYDICDVVEDNSKHDFVRVLVGHSATETCQHIETFKILSRFKKQICVVCPLSYPVTNENYRNKVIKAGKEIFGEHFEAITDYMPYDKYINFLNNIDVGVFNNNREQGYGNIINLILLGKKVYISADNPAREFHSLENGYYTFKVEDIDETIMQPLTKEQKENNRKKILYILSDEYFKEKWGKIYSLRG